MIPARQAIFSQVRQIGSELFLTQKRHSFYNKYRHGPQKITNPDPPYMSWIKEFFTKDGMRYLKSELRQTMAESFKMKYYLPVCSDKLVKIEEFDSDESIKRWKPVADRDSLNGYSESKIIRSPAGHALFTGILDNEKPDDGMTSNSGFVGIMGPQAPRKHPFQREAFWDWSQFNCIEIKCRGDGRKYQVVLNTSTYTSDLQYYDCFSYFLHTRGGPYWQTVRIPFHKFVFNYKNFIQDLQTGMLPTRIKFVAITLQDGFDGPFALEIDHIGLIHETNSLDTKSAYEGYTFEHVKYRPINVDCPAPES